MKEQPEAGGGDSVQLGRGTRLPVLSEACGTDGLGTHWPLPTRFQEGLDRPARVLLVGPYDPHCGEYTFLAPPLGVWRLKGVLTAAGVDAMVFDPNLEGPASEHFARVLAQGPWDVIGISTTGMTLRFDLALAHQARRLAPGAVMIAGGMEATFRPELMFELGPFDLVALGEGEAPLLALAEVLGAGGPSAHLPGTAFPGAGGSLVQNHQATLDPEAFSDAVFKTPYAEMPYEAYWKKLEDAYRIGALPHKAAREARLSEIRSVRVNTLNYCPMGCSFCSSTNFLHAAKAGTAKIRRLSAEELLDIVHRVVRDQPRVRTVIFQDDIFVFTKDDRILPLCEGIVAAKASGTLPADLEFISTNRIDAMTRERMDAMRRAGFRVLGFGVESFSASTLKEFNKQRIVPFIEPNLRDALDLGITPFLDLILTSPRCSIDDLAKTIREGFHWLLAGCEMGMYPYVIPFSGAAMARDESLAPHTVSEIRTIDGTHVTWPQPAKILPIDPEVRRTILAMERRVNLWLEALEPLVPHIPSRLRSLLWILSASLDMAADGHDVPTADVVREELMDRLPQGDADATRALRAILGATLGATPSATPVRLPALVHAS